MLQSTLYEAYKGLGLVDAATLGNTEVVDALINAGANVNTVKSGRTALHSAALLGHADIVTALINAPGIDLNVTDDNGRTALHTAVQLDRTEIVTALINAGADVNVVDNDGWNALRTAADNEHINIIAALIKAGAKVNVPGDISSDKSQESKLLLAARDGKITAVIALLSAGINVNAVSQYYGMTALHWALTAAVNQIKMRDGNPFDRIGSFIRYDDVITTLITTPGLDVNAVDDHGQTALRIAVDLRSEGNEILTALINAGANVNIVDCNKQTALYAAALNGDADIVTILLAAGANINLDVEITLYYQNQFFIMLTTVLNSMNARSPLEDVIDNNGNVCGRTRSTTDNEVNIIKNFHQIAVKNKFEFEEHLTQSQKELFNYLDPVNFSLCNQLQRLLLTTEEKPQETLFTCSSSYANSSYTAVNSSSEPSSSSIQLEIDDSAPKKLTAHVRPVG